MKILLSTILLFITFGLQAQSISYDNMGRVTSITYAGSNATVTYTYNAVGSRTGVTTVSAGLPVEWLYFAANPDTEGHNKSLLEWATASESNCSHYVIEHSTDGINFSPVGEMVGAGTTVEEQQYNFIHDEPVTGMNYYRLKQVDFDDKFEYSLIESVKFEMEIPKLSMNLFPNPTFGVLNIDVEEIISMPIFQVFDVQGKSIHAHILNDSGSRWTLNTANLPSGHYFLQMRQGDLILNKKFIVAK